MLQVTLTSVNALLLTAVGALAICVALEEWQAQRVALLLKRSIVVMLGTLVAVGLVLAQLGRISVAITMITNVRSPLFSWAWSTTWVLVGAMGFVISHLCWAKEVQTKAWATLLGVSGLMLLLVNAQTHYALLRPAWHTLWLPAWGLMWSGVCLGVMVHNSLKENPLSILITGEPQYSIGIPPKSLLRFLQGVLAGLWIVSLGFGVHATKVLSGIFPQPMTTQTVERMLVVGTIGVASVCLLGVLIAITHELTANRSNLRWSRLRVEMILGMVLSQTMIALLGVL